MATSQQFLKKSVRSSIFSHFPTRLFVFLFVLMSFAVSAQATLVNFQWNASTGAVAGYKLHRGTVSGTYVASVTLTGTGTTGSMDLDPATSHYVAATAYDSSNRESAYSNEILCHPVTASAGTGGSISPSGTFFSQQGSNVTFSLTPNSGYRVNSLLINGSSVGSVTSYTLSGVSGKVTVSAVFEPIPPTTYTITVTPPTNGTISPSGSVSVSAGGSKSFTITANTGYRIADVKANGVSVGAVSSYTFNNVMSNQTLSATFAINTYTISATAGANGSISPSSATVNHGSSQTFTITPNQGYKVADVKVNNTSVGAVTSYTFTNVQSAQTISATFAVNTYTITATAGANGSISPSSATVNHGSSQTFTITPNQGYKVADVKVNNTSVGAVTSYTFTNVQSAQTISATFAINTYTIAVATPTNGTITPSGNVSVNHGATQTFTITPASGYEIDKVLVDEASVGAVGTYTFSNVDKGHTLSAQFVKRANQSPVAHAGPDQTVAEGSVITLSGAGSTDPDDGIASYSWVQLTGPEVVLSGSTLVSPTFTAPNVGPEGAALTFQLTVTDFAGLSSVDTCIVNITWVNQPPVANAGPSQTVAEGILVQLDGSASSDSDDGVATYDWVQKSGPTVTINNKSSAVASFMPPNVGVGGASLSFELTVADKGGLKATAQTIVNVTWVNAPPIANAGPDKAAYEGEYVTLDGSASSDPDDGIVAYEWTHENGSPVTLISDTQSPQLTFLVPAVGASGEVFTFKLTVTDASGLKSIDTCTVSVSVAQGPDLTGSWASLSYKSGKITGSLTVRNVGSQSAGYNYVAFYLSSDGKKLDKYITRKSITTTAAGASKSVSFSYSKTGLTGQYIVAVADYTDRVKELKEDNNHGPVVIPTMIRR